MSIVKHSIDSKSKFCYKILSNIFCGNFRDYLSLTWIFLAVAYIYQYDFLLFLNVRKCTYLPYLKYVI